MKVSGQRLDQKLKELMMEKIIFIKKLIVKFRINTEDDLPLNESLKFLCLIVNINLVLGVDNKLYRQICLDECFYKL